MSGVLGTNTVTQVALIVKDIEATKQKYAEFFGVEAPPTIDGGDFEVTGTMYMGSPAPRAGAKLAFFDVGPGLALELIEPNGEQSTWQDFLDKNGEGLHHIAFNVKGMDGKLEACEKLGMITTQRGKYGNAAGEYAYLDATRDLKLFVELLENY